MADLDATLAALAVDYWKLLRSFERLAEAAAPDQSNRLLAQARFSNTRLAGHLEAAGMQLASFDGQEITPAIPVIAINADECEDLPKIIVASTVEPAVVMGSRVLAMGRVIAAKGTADVRRD